MGPIPRSTERISCLVSSLIFVHRHIDDSVTMRKCAKNVEIEITLDVLLRLAEAALRTTVMKEPCLYCTSNLQFYLCD